MTSAPTQAPEQVDPSVKELISSAANDVSTLLSAQVELAKAELKETASKTASAVALFVVAGVFLFLAFVFLLVTLAYVLVQLGLPVWAGFGIVTALLIIVAGILALVGKKHANKIKGPEKTIYEIDETKKALGNLKAS